MHSYLSCSVCRMVTRASKGMSPTRNSKLEHHSYCPFNRALSVSLDFCHRRVLQSGRELQSFYIQDGHTTAPSHMPSAERLGDSHSDSPCASDVALAYETAIYSEDGGTSLAHACTYLVVAFRCRILPTQKLGPPPTHRPPCVSPLADVHINGQCGFTFIICALSL